MASAERLESLVLGRYRVGDLLGRGGMGAVYAAVDTHTGKQIALKRLTTDDERAHVLFEREYRTLAGLRHPRIVEVFEYGVDGQGAFYTMELLSGGDLNGQAPMPWREVCACLRDAASTLGVLHARRLVHRDLSANNLWRTPDGRLKLLDFGGLTPFGGAREIVGTPPFVAPEALAGSDLDQRTDLYALGALGYWLLTGTHAYPAHSLNELRGLWSDSPAPPSSMLRLLDDDAAKTCPPELDVLLLSLLALNPAERPTTTVDVIDSLNAIAELEPEVNDVVVQGYMDSKAFVGRDSARRRFSASLRRADQGKPLTLWFEGPEGIGRTRLLDELVVTGRIGGATVLRVGASSSQGAYGTAYALGLAMLRETPEVARRTAASRAGVLAHLSEELANALGAEPTAALLGKADQRARKQLALTEWFLAASRQRTLVLLVDDLQDVDEESQAFLAALARSEAGHRLLLVVTESTEDQGAERSQAASALRDEARCIPLAALDEARTRSLLHSLFGDVPHIDRVAARLHEVAQGNPRHTLLLTEHLVETGVIHYADGTWSLPKEVPDEGLPQSLREGVLARAARLSDGARHLARLLSVPDHGPFTRAMCAELCQPTPERVPALVAELVRCGVASENAEGVRLTHPALGEVLCDELTETQRVQAHRRLAQHLLEAADGSDLKTLRASLHLLRAGEVDRARVLLKQTGEAEVKSVSEGLHAAAPMYVEAVGLLEQRGLDDRDMLLPLAVLAIASYYVHPRFGPELGDRAVPAFEQVLGMKWATRLQGWLGRKVGLLVTLIVAGVGLRLRRHAPALPVAVHSFMFAASCLCGRSTTSMQPDLGNYYAEVIEPLTGLGPEHAVSMAHQFSRMIAMTAQECSAKHHQESLRLQAWLESERPIEGLNDDVRQVYLASTLYTSGVRGGFRNPKKALEAAEALDAFGPQFSVNACQLRTMYYAAIGDFERADEYRALMGVRAIQLGTAWRIDTIASVVTVPLLWARDAIALKRAAVQLARLATNLPSFDYHARAVLAAHHVMRGKPRQALELVDGLRQDLFVAGSARTRSVVAAAHNALGQHDAARQVCLSALAELSEADLAYFGLNGPLQVELALAEAALLHTSTAAERLDALLEAHTGKGPLLAAYLHRVRAHIALLALDRSACHMHVGHALDHAKKTAIPSLIAWVRELEWELRRAENEESGEYGSLQSMGRAQLAQGVRQMLRASTGTELESVCERVLRISMDLSGAKAGMLLAHLGDRAAKVDGGVPCDTELEAWARERLNVPADNDCTEVLSQQETTSPAIDLEDPYVREMGGQHYRMTTLFTGPGGGRGPTALGVLLLGSPYQPPARLGEDVLVALAEGLSELSTTHDAKKNSA